jgi:hypothetical protein
VAGPRERGLARDARIRLTSGGFSGSGGVLEQNVNVGSSYFHSLNVRVQRRPSKGLMLMGNYVFSKLKEEDTWLNDTDLPAG